MVVGKPDRRSSKAARPRPSRAAGFQQAHRHNLLNRQSKIFARHGVTLSYSTICDWMKAFESLEPRTAKMRPRILRRP